MKKRRNNKHNKLIHRVSVILTVLLVSVVLLVTLEPGTAKSSTGTDYNIVIVREGDTLWKIAEANNTNGDLRELIYDIKEINKLDSPVIQPGQQLLIPVNTD